jgi:hypothetical protein
LGDDQALKRVCVAKSSTVGLHTPYPATHKVWVEDSVASLLQACLFAMRWLVIDVHLLLLA